MASGIVGDGTLPIGRRVAQLRTRLGMSQQVFADRVGRSTSWVDKVERGVRSLDRLSVIGTVADALGVAPTVLLDQNTRGESATTIAPALERVRAVLACYDTPIADGRSPTKELVTRIGYAWAAYAHAQHQQVLATLPDLLTEARHARPVAVPAGPEPAADLLGRVYRLAARLLVKLGEPELAWLAADRAIATSAGDPRRTALAVIPMAQALRALDRGRLAMTATITAVHRLAPHPSREPAPTDAALAGTLLVQAALAAAGCGDASTAHDLTDRATDLTRPYGDQPHAGDDEVAFGPAAVDLARALVAVELGDNDHAIGTHVRVTGGEAWSRLPAEHRAAHLIDITRAYLNTGDHRAAGRALVTADRLAPAETRLRPAARTALTAVLRAGPPLADVTGLATTIGLIRAGSGAAAG
ncbi:helix-turn-helix domain-containing protein [Micromonospora zhanjiangensis]|uniref:Helix-turn-helix domain-containing protein n=1 Tax=Micromonospora zhanjiangensis TaxID=1522057 RepID=A0ABV8KG63_9ACTN